MAKKHYIIEAKGAEYISGNKITIEDCTYIEKNHRILEKNGKYRNIANFEYKIDASSGKYSYNFNRLIVVDHSIDKLSDEFEKYPILDNIQNDTSVFTTFRMCGDMYDESAATILNETLCSKYNLTCSRW